MALTPIQGKTGILKVDGTACLGVKSVRLPKNWSTEKVMCLGDTSPTTLLNYKDWTMSVDLVLDLHEAQQKALWDAYVAGTSVAIIALPDGVATYTTTALVTQFEMSVDAQRVNTGTVTLGPYNGAALVWDDGIP